MSNLILDWLLSLNLSREVSSFGESFKDGCLLGEILHKYNQQKDFDKFCWQGTTLGIIRNFELLDASMRLVGIHFTTKIAAEVMRGNESVTKTLLYELKVCLDRITRNSRQSTNPLLWGTRNDKILSVVGTTRPKFDASRANTVHQSIKDVLENTNTILMKSAVKKYTDREEEYNLTIKRGEMADLDSHTLHRLRAKEIYKSRKEHAEEFNEAWDSLNLDQWRKNQRKAHDRKTMYHSIDENIQRQKEKYAQKAKEETKSYALQSLDAFDQRLETLIISEDRNSSGKSMIGTLK